MVEAFLKAIAFTGACPRQPARKGGQVSPYSMRKIPAIKCAKYLFFK
jgi:hypothetical protein